jgi:hypothetical protein
LEKVPFRKELLLPPSIFDRYNYHPKYPVNRNPRVGQMALQTLFLALQFLLVVCSFTLMLVGMLEEIIGQFSSFISFIILTLAHIACLAVATKLRNFVWISLLRFSPERHVEPGWWTLFLLVQTVYFAVIFFSPPPPDTRILESLVAISIFFELIFLEFVLFEFLRNEWSAWIIYMWSETTPLGRGDLSAGAIPKHPISWVSIQSMGTGDTAMSQTLSKQDLVAMEPAGAENGIVPKSSVVGRLPLWLTILCLFTAAFVITGLYFHRRRPSHGRGYKYERLNVGSNEIKTIADSSKCQC